jgi:1-acyl-sn-glycerol-3-phosphate acyltransferase
MDTIPKRLRRASANRGNLPKISGAQQAAQVPALRGLGPVRAVRRATWIVLFVPVAILIQSVLLLLPGRAHVPFATFFWGAIARMLGLQVRVVGAPLRSPQKGRQTGKAGSARPVVYVCNHSSWLDIPAIGGRIPARFVSKDDVAAWPIIGTIARLGRTVFVSRSRAGTLRERDAMQRALAAGDDLLLFPEGTSSDGSRVLPFRSAFFAAAFGGTKPLIQPVSVVYDRLAGLPVGHASRAVFAWYGDMSLVPHFWQLAQWRGKRVTLLFHTPLDPADFADRKALAQATWQVVADGAAALRQNRPARPLPESAPENVPASHGAPAFA